MTDKSLDKIAEEIEVHGPHFYINEKGLLDSFTRDTPYRSRAHDVIYLVPDELHSIVARETQRELAEKLVGDDCLGVIVFPDPDVIPWNEWKAHKARKANEKAQEADVDAAGSTRGAVPFCSYEKGLMALLTNHPEASAIDLIIHLAQMLDSDVRFIKLVAQMAQKQHAQARVFSALENLKAALSGNAQAQQAEAEKKTTD